MKRVAIVLVFIAGAGLVMSACGSTGTTAQTTSTTPTTAPITAQTPAASLATDHNDQDVMFAQMMIPHHRQAVEMAQLAEDRAASDDVKQLAEQIEAAQDPEIQTMSGWLTSWGVPVPSEDSMPMDHGIPGMMSGEDMKSLEGLKGGAFDKAFLKMMIQHHQGAITMAEREQAEGAFEPAKQMAAAIISSQSAEISTMEQLLQ